MVTNDIKITIDPYEAIKEVLETEVDDLAFTYAKTVCTPEGIQLGSDEFIDYYMRVRDVYRTGGDKLVYFMHMSMITVCTILEGNGLFINIPADFDDDKAGKMIEAHILESSRCIAAALMHLYATEPESLPTNTEFSGVPANARSVSFTFTRKTGDVELH